MTTIRITKEFTFEAAHALDGYDGPCKSVHGHSYGLSVTIKGTPLTDPDSPKKGMVMDFGDLKKIIKKQVIDRFDHALLLCSTGREVDTRGLGDIFSNVVYVDYQPTSENILAEIAGKIKGLLPAGITLHSLRLRETGSSYAEWFAEDNG